jgi:hypothetical protein
VCSDNHQHDGARLPEGGNLQRLTQNVLIAGNGDPALSGDSAEPFGIGRGRVVKDIVMPYDREVLPLPRRRGISGSPSPGR